MAIEQSRITSPVRVNPYTVPADHQDWRGLGLEGPSAKRRAYTLFWNEQVLVCGLLLLPGEHSIRHSHESGELSISFSDALHPSVGYTPGGLLHGGSQVAGAAAAPGLADALAAGMPELRSLLDEMIEEQRKLRQELQELRAPAGPRMLIDILFPPFKTTIDDPAYAEPKTIVGPWYD
ncbi:MAG TPA: hypothetical protein VFY10_15145 [Dehalococcoidia bacterium]|nr:hypothetical protein [Dehalococcoidia bacterium]